MQSTAKEAAQQCKQVGAARHLIDLRCRMAVLINVELVVISGHSFEVAADHPLGRTAS
jgi:hypothetical protein